MLMRRSRFRTLFLCLALEVGLMAGVPMRPDEIARLMRALAGPQVVQTRPDEADRGDGGPPEDPRIP